ncbi:MAG: penicillin-binding protein 1C [Spirochaetales bacterium]|nr:penicillin-binding protein 1C [Spirochaetales bacterium]
MWYSLAIGRPLWTKKNRIRFFKLRIFFVVFLFVFVFLPGVFHLCPKPSLLGSLDFSRAVYDRDGRLMRLTLTRDDKYRLKTESIPAVLYKAILFKEDRYFFYHPGVNPLSIARGFVHTFITRQGKMGGSTITMQLARLMYKLNTRDLPGKFIQMGLALAIEYFYTKREIAEAYCSLAPCGNNYEGFAAASLVYFRKPLSELSQLEAFTLAVIPQSPLQRTPERQTNNASLVKARNKLVEQWIKENPGDKALLPFLDFPLAIQARIPFNAPHFVNTLLQKYTQREKLATTIDMRYQGRLEEIAYRYVMRRRHLGIQNASLLLLDYETMEVKASVGSVEFFNEKIEGQVNGVYAKRSPGSTIKPFIYALAMEQGLIHPMTLLKDVPTNFNGYNPDNYDGEFEGPVTAQAALVRSRNIPAVYLAGRLSNPDTYDFLKTAGISELRPKETYGLSLVLGSLDLSSMELAELYAMLANKGVMQPALELIPEKEDSRKGKNQLLTPEACFIVLDVLKNNQRPDALPQTGGNDNPAPVYWKTGTSIGFRDAWTVGIFDNFVLVVWIGNFDGAGNPAFLSLKAAAPLFFEIVDTLRNTGLTRYSSRDFPFRIPDNVKQVEVCALSGQIPGLHCPKTVFTWFVPGVSPITPCTIHREIFVNAKTGYRAMFNEPGKTRSEIVEFWPSDLLALFEAAGLPRKTPPPFPPGTTDTPAQGKAPEIISPVGKNAYVVRNDTRTYDRIPFVAVTDADCAEVFWFVNENYIGESKTYEPFFWEGEPGLFTVRALDKLGRSDVRKIEIIVAD